MIVSRMKQPYQTVSLRLPRPVAISKENLEQVKAKLCQYRDGRKGGIRILAETLGVARQSVMLVLGGKRNSNRILLAAIQLANQIDKLEAKKKEVA